MKMRTGFLAGLFFVGLTLRAQPTMLMSPYLQAVTKTSIEVLVESRTQDPVTIRYGKGEIFTDSTWTSRIDQTDLPSYVHTVKLEKLLPNTVYRYQARQGHELSRPGSFRTAPEAGTPFRFAWMADCRVGIGVHDTIAERIAAAEPVVLLLGGDLASTGSYDAYKKEFFRPAELSLIANVPFFNTVGNHEGWTTNTRAFTRGLPANSGTEEYYSFDYSDLHVVVLNTQLPYGPGSAQYDFVARDLASAASPWKIVIAHKHAYCGGGHGEDSGLKEMTTNLFEPNHVAMVLSGHSHFFEHNIVNGIHHLIIGSAGAPLYNPESEWYTVSMAKSYNYAVGDVSPSQLRLMVYDERGAVLDSVVLRRTPSPDGSGTGKGMGALFPVRESPASELEPVLENLRVPSF